LSLPVPLHVHSHFSLLRGASGVEALVTRAAELGYQSLALTDRDALYGAIQFSTACRAAGLTPIIGSEITLVTDHHLTLLAENETGYANLCRLLTTARHSRPKGEAALPFEALPRHAEGLIALSGSRTGEIPSLLLAGRRAEAVCAADRYHEIFGDRFYLEIQNHHLPDDAWLMAEIAALGQCRKLPLVATTDVHYARLEQRMLQDVLTCIRTKTTMTIPSVEKLPNGHFGMKSPDELRRLFRRYPDALVRTGELATRCGVSLDFSGARFPPLDLPDGESPDVALRRLCFEGARRRYRSLTERVVRQLEHELTVVGQTGLAAFFLIAADVARRFNGRCRGSAAGSLLVYCLGISAVDPLDYGMLFERFINPDRPTMPDIDIDFSEWDREAAIAYIYQRYGAEHAAMVCNYVRYRARLAVRDVGKALGMPDDFIDRLAKSLDHHAGGAELAGQIAAVGEQLTDEGQPWPLLTQLCQEIDDCPRHLSVHVGGMLITGRPLIELFALEPARKAGIVVVSADKEDVEDSGLGKLDLLCLRALSVIQEAQALERTRGVPLTLETIDLEEPAIYGMLTVADTMGVSQVESRAQMQSVVRTRPTCFRDLINQCAIIRPGPIVAGMVHPYNRRRLGLESVNYLHPLLEPILRDTLGILLFQEQIILAVIALTGCPAGEADMFRRAMGSHRSREAMEKLKPWFLEQTRVNGMEQTISGEVFRQIAGFAEFGFCRSHSAALARIAYEGMYLKRYHPAAFAAALLSNQPLGFYPVEVLVWDARRHGVRFLPVDIDHSGARCALEGDPPMVRLGFEQVRGVGRERAKQIVTEREVGGSYRSLRDFLDRVGLSGKSVEGLILTGAFDRLEGSRPKQLWELYGHRTRGSQGELGLVEPEPPVAFPQRSNHQQTLLDHHLLGFSVRFHLVEQYRLRLRSLGVVASHQLAGWPVEREVRVGGLVVCRQRPRTAKGYLFLTLEDERGLMNIIVRPDVYGQYRDTLRQHPLLAVAGRLQRAFGTVNVLAERVLALDPAIPDGSMDTAPAPVPAGIRSHDFH